MAILLDLVGADDGGKADSRGADKTNKTKLAQSRAKTK
jgi:hypothetical protein